MHQSYPGKTKILRTEAIKDGRQLEAQKFSYALAHRQSSLNT